MTADRSRHDRRLDYPAFAKDPDAPLACRAPDVDPEWFFPSTGDGTILRKAKEVCAGCPAKAPCLEWSLEQPARDIYGVWGGLYDTDREKLRAIKRYEDHTRAEAS